MSSALHTVGLKYHPKEDALERIACIFGCVGAAMRAQGTTLLWMENSNIKEGQIRRSLEGEIRG